MTSTPGPVLTTFARNEGRLLAALEGHCVRGFTADHYKVVAARLISGNLGEAAAILGYSKSQVRRRWDQIKELILVPLGLPSHDDALVGMWMVLHGEHCSSEVFRLLKSDSRFTTFR